MQRKKSRELYERALRVVPGGSHSYVRNSIPLGYMSTPPFFARAEGNRLYDVDSNEYIDYVLGYGPIIFGHAPEFIIEAITKELKKGWLYTGESDLNVELAETFCRVVPCAEQVVFDTDGTKATMYALKFARAYTKRDKVIKFEGHYHGMYDPYTMSVAPPLSEAGPEDRPVPVPSYAGVPGNTAENVIVQPWNNEAILEETVKTRGHEVAAIIMEPIAANGTVTPPKKGYLEFVRRITRDNGIVLIFDEIVTGFRVALGGAQEFFGVTPDLASFGKILGHGLPISAIAGKREIMEVAAKMHGGTVNANRVSSAASKAVLDRLSSEKSRIYPRLNQLGEQLMRGMRDSAKDAQVDVLMQGYGPVFGVFFTNLPEISNYREQAKGASYALAQGFSRQMFERGVFQEPHIRWLNTTAHTEEDIEKTVTASYESFKEVRKMEKQP